MKYGQTFHAQSVPQWAACESPIVWLVNSIQAIPRPRRSLIVTLTDNVDYDELKNLIKANTTKDQAQAIAIPGQEDPRLEKFETSFFNELSNQHDRVDLFVKSKADEISRRLRMLYSCRIVGYR